MPDEDNTKAETLLQRSAFEKFIRYGNGENSLVQMSTEEKRALANSADSDGGFLVPIDFESTGCVFAIFKRNSKQSKGGKNEKI